MNKLESAAKSIATKERRERAAAFQDSVSQTASELRVSTSILASEIKEKVTGPVTSSIKLEKAELRKYMQDIKLRLHGFFSKFIYVVFALCISFLLTYLSYLMSDGIFGLIVAANMTGIDVFLGDVAPFVLIGLIWFFTYRVIKKKLAWEPPELD